VERQSLVGLQHVESRPEVIPVLHPLASQDDEVATRGGRA
jgi:hypothetical protein